MIDVKALLDDKVTWKICESVHLGMEAIHLTYLNIADAAEEYTKGRESGIYKDFEKVAKVSYRYTLTDTIIKDYRENILPHLPKGWWAVEKPWMECGDYA